MSKIYGGTFISKLPETLVKPILFYTSTWDL